MLEKPLAIACAVLVMLCGFFYVRMNWALTDLAQYRADVAVNTQKAETEARAKETAMRNQVERIAKNDADKQAKLADRAAGADAATRSLRDDIARLNAGDTPASPELAAIARQARTARELLGACSEEYRGVARSADELSTQVSGLQDYATNVCKP
ncbi:hypothetical protein UFOVP33_60 [uncultured Caudovirales phage]|uniref:Uncharacterized protein n=1 Tax=uncultured Caudovirales phage TaxID=2100421 RepID=A0A6J5KRF4_9CAUD|nr:hypothetical protein UFOVP33_60 [uncultured Caudovirales phage]